MTVVLVTGATGELGRHVVRHLIDRGHAARRLLRRAHPLVAGVEDIQGDLKTGQGIEAAVSGVDAVIHCASSPIRPGAVDTGGAKRLLRSLEAANPSAHFVYISIVGIDDHPYYYFRAKLATELAIERSPIASTIQRATQFHEFFVRLLRPFDRWPFAVVLDGLRSQPIAASEAALRLVEIVGDGPQGRTPDISGPAVLELEDLARRYRRAIGAAPRLVRFPMVGRAGAAFREGRQLLPEPHYGRQTFDDFLVERFGRAA